MIFLTLFSLCSLSTELKICINKKLENFDLKADELNSISKEILFKNIYETLFYYDKANNKISSNVAKELKKIDKLNYEVVLKDNVQFHNNKVFFVKKNVDYKDVIFSIDLVEDPKLKIQYKNKKLIITTDMSYAELYRTLSGPKYVIYSRAYYNYLKKKKRLKLFYTRPIGTGPFLIEKISGAPYVLKDHKKYHLKNRLNQITYQISSSYLKDSCDIFWNFDKFKIKEFTVKNGYKVVTSRPNNLLLMVNKLRDKELSSLFDPFKMNKDLLKDLNTKLTTTVIPSFIKDSYVMNPRKTSKVKEDKTINIHIDQSVDEVTSIDSMKEYIRKQISTKYLELNFIDTNSDDAHISIALIKNIDSLKDLNKKVLCPYLSKACNSYSDIKSLHETLLKDESFIPLGYISKNLFYKKTMINVKPDFNHTIDYSEILYIKN